MDGDENSLIFFYTQQVLHRISTLDSWIKKGYGHPPLESFNYTITQMLRN